MPKLIRTLHLDPSDAFVFDHAAEPGEWAAPGSGLFEGFDLEAASPKWRAAFRSGFLSLRTFGFSTLVEIAEINKQERDALVDGFACELVSRFKVPNFALARRLASDEITFAESLCDHDLGTVVAVRRTLESGTIREQFRTLNRRPGGFTRADRLHAYSRAFDVVDVDEEEMERIDLAHLIVAGPPEKD
jgi:hypothetical protein